MGELLIQVHKVIRDLRSSWYFRVWALLWVICLIMGFVALGILGQKSEASMKYPTMNTWIENATSLTFPRFHIRTQGSETIKRLECSRNNVVIQNLACDLPQGVPLGSVAASNNCIAVHSDTIEVTNNPNSPLGDVMIYCSLTTEGSNPGSLVVWGLEGQNVGPFGPNAFSGIYIGPNNNSWVVLEKRTVHESVHLPRQTQWSRSLIYHTNGQVPGFYGITTIMGSFYVQHMEPDDVFDGWKAFGNIGGFIFMLVVVHTIVMLLVGIVFENRSEFIKGQTLDDKEMSSQKSPLLNGTHD